MRVPLTVAGHAQDSSPLRLVTEGSVLILDARQGAQVSPERPPPPTNLSNRRGCNAPEYWWGTACTKSTKVGSLRGPLLHRYSGSTLGAGRDLH
jgi:hypothetical protein